MTYYTRKDWGARPALPGPGPLEPGRVEGLVFHWPAMSRPIGTVAGVSAALRAWQAYHMDSRGWSDIAYQEAVDQAGNVYELRGLRNQSGANGDTDVNQRFGAVLLVLAPGEKPSRKMIRAVRGRVGAHRRLFPQSKRLAGHGEVRPDPTDCPGSAVRAALRAGVFEPRPRVVWTRGVNVDHAIDDLEQVVGRKRLIGRALDALQAIKPWPKRRR